MINIFYCVNAYLIKLFEYIKTREKTFKIKKIFSYAQPAARSSTKLFTCIGLKTRFLYLIDFIFMHFNHFLLLDGRQIFTDIFSSAQPVFQLGGAQDFFTGCKKIFATNKFEFTNVFTTSQALKKSISLRSAFPKKVDFSITFFMGHPV